MAEFTTSLTEYTHLNEMQDRLRRQLAEANRRDVARADSMRATVLSLVVAEEYPRAIHELEAYIEWKGQYPEFQQRASRYATGCTELITAIQTKRHFPGLSSLSLSKQQEIYDKVLEHFEDLKNYLKQIEKVEREQMVNDVRSTVWVLRSFCYAAFAIFLTGLVLDVRKGAFMSFPNVVGTYVDHGVDMLFRMLHL